MENDKNILSPCGTGLSLFKKSVIITKVDLEVTFEVKVKVEVKVII